MSVPLRLPKLRGAMRVPEACGVKRNHGTPRGHNQSSLSVITNLLRTTGLCRLCGWGDLSGNTQLLGVWQIIS